MVDFKLPGLDWFMANPWDKVGNRYTGSYGANSIHKNAFLYILNFYRYDDKDPELVAQVYDTKMKMNNEEPTEKSFEGTQKGMDEMKAWLNEMYEKHVSSGKEDEEILF